MYKTFVSFFNSSQNNALLVWVFMPDQPQVFREGMGRDFFWYVHSVSVWRTWEVSQSVQFGVICYFLNSVHQDDVIWRAFKHDWARHDQGINSPHIKPCSGRHPHQQDV